MNINFNIIKTRLIHQKKTIDASRNKEYLLEEYYYSKGIVFDDKFHLIFHQTHFFSLSVHIHTSEVISTPKYSLYVLLLQAIIFQRLLTRNCLIIMRLTRSYVHIVCGDKLLK